MTYGANGGQLRDALATLLRQHRIQQRLGGPGSHTIPETTTVEERAALGALIARYRHAVLVYCRISATAVNPNTPLDRTSVRTRGPAEELRYQLDRAVEGSTAGLPTMDELTTPQNLDLVESWRRAAQASALGEHDFPAGLSWGTLTDQQCRTVLKDAAEITQGLVVLDQRYKNIPGWAALRDCASLGRAAQVCAVFAGYDGQDHTVDLRGWRPSLEMIDGPDPGGFAGVIQTEQNLLIHLTRFPDARGLRLVIDSQRVLSHELGVRVREDFPTISNRWAGRAATYTRLAQECRNVAGLLGDGRNASADGSILLSRLRKVPSTQPLAPEQAKSLVGLFNRIDARVSEIIEEGIAERLYFLRVKVPRLSNEATGMIRRVRQRYAPITSQVQTDLLRLARDQLRPAPMQPTPPPGAAESRRKLQEAILHRPQPRGDAPRLG
jgi:hypothetical protein